MRLILLFLAFALYFVYFVKTQDCKNPGAFPSDEEAEKACSMNNLRGKYTDWPCLINKEIIDASDANLFKVQNIQAHKKEGNVKRSWPSCETSFHDTIKSRFMATNEDTFLVLPQRNIAD